MDNNYQTINRIKLKEKMNTKSIKFFFEHPASNIPAALFGIIVS
ncbi:hypothetical protein BH23BAC1_BH23BAC1_16810 [soil metagenome]